LVRHPEHAATIERVLQIGPKRHERALVTYLTEPELDALIDAPDRASWTGRRDHAIIILLAQTGLRASELTGLACGDIHLGTGAHATTTGKGRKQRITPLTKETTAVLRVWLAERGGEPVEPLFPTSTGKPLTRKALARRVAKHATHAAQRCPSLAAKTITPHVLRHTAAMRLLHAGVDTTVIALWLGHEQVETTQMYLHADLALKERALALTKPLDSKPATARRTRSCDSSTDCEHVVPDCCIQQQRRRSALAGRVEWRLRFWRGAGTPSAPRAARSRKPREPGAGP
jgi:integrase/recombinase XerD